MSNAMSEQSALSEFYNSAQYIQPESSHFFHLSLGDGVSPEAVKAALAQAGIDAAVTPCTHERDGVILTDRMASFTWDSKTGNDDCDQSCSEDGGPAHVNYRDLSPEQRFLFVNRVADVMNYYRGDCEITLDGIAATDNPVRTQACV